MRQQRIEAARACARRLLRRFGVVAPEHIDIDIFCEALGVEVVTCPLVGADAQLVNDGHKVTILASDRITDPQERRFNIAHELGHFLLEHRMRIPSRIAGPDAPRSSLEEAEASAFAAELLMPERLIRAECDLSRADLAVPKQISDRYNVSLLAGAIRFAELAAEPCAAVFSIASRPGTGKVKWVVPSASFEYRIPRGKPLSPASVASGYFEKGELTEYPRRVSPPAWFDVASEDYVIEHAVASQEYGTVISMLWVLRAK